MAKGYEMLERAARPRPLNTVAILGSYVPRQCGIATFTKDLRDAIVAGFGDGSVLVLAMDDKPSGYIYSPEVNFQIRAYQPDDYRVAADLLNIDQIDMAVVQHEFGIFGGPDGGYLLEFIRRLRMPIMCTLHTILERPSKGQMRVMQQLARRCDRLVAMSHLGENILREVYAVPPHKIAFIPHGIPDVPFVDTSFYKEEFGTEGRTVILTFGLLSPGKAIEVALRALPEVVKKHPEVIYIVLGATHPGVLASEGEIYRWSLEALVDELGLQGHVIFENRFVSIEELCRYIGSADLYVTPYQNEAQITSGTLAYAMGAGKAVVSTPYLYAKEMLAEERGHLFPFGDSEALAERILYMLDNEVERSAMRKRAYLYARPMIWEQVGQGYLALARDVLKERERTPRPVAARVRSKAAADIIPGIDLRHLRIMTDCTGMLQHALYSVPDRLHGYCTDDNSRALVATMMYYDLTQDASVLPLVSTYLSFLNSAWDKESGRFRNFMTYERQWVKNDCDDDVQGRSLWALGLCAAMAPTESLLAFSTRLFNVGLVTISENLTSPRAWALVLVGIHAYLRRFSGDVHARQARKVLADKLYALFQACASSEWPWCENVITYSNAKLPHALILSGQWIPDGPMLDQGLASLKWLLELQIDENDCVSLIGNQGWCTRDGNRARFDQQPVEAVALIEACAEAYRCTSDEYWVGQAVRCLGWFLGDNDTQSVLYDANTGGCRDGLLPHGPNQNQGAESTLSWLVSLITVHNLIKQGKAKPSVARTVGERDGGKDLCPSRL